MLGEFQVGWELASTEVPVLESVSWRTLWAEEQVPMTGQDSASLLYWWVVWVLGCQVVHCQTVKVLAWSSKRSLDKL